MEFIVGMGGNLGDPPATFLSALGWLERTQGLVVGARSRLYRTPPLGPPQPEYNNAAVRVTFDSSSEALLDRLHAIERAHGRDRTIEERWGARTLDLDLLYVFGPAIESERLTVPHRELTQRPFALAPLLDVAPELAAEYGACLSSLGGTPPVVPWPDT